MSLKTWFIRRKVGEWKGDAVSGKLGQVPKAVWAFLNGKKTIIWAVVVALQRAFPNWEGWGLVRAAAAGLGWDNIQVAIDPDQLVLFGTLALALGHKFYKSWKETPVDVEWKTVGKLPDIKDLSKVPEAPALKVVEPEFEMVEVRSKETIPVGKTVSLPDGRRGVLMGTKESSSTGYTYVVRAEKK